MDEPNLQIGDKLKAARITKGLTLRELADRADVSASLLSKLENGKTNPSVRSLHNIAEALSLPINDFFPQQSSASTQPDDADRNGDEEFPLTPSQVRTQGHRIIQDSALAGPVISRDTRQVIKLLGGVSWERLTAETLPQVEFLECVYDVGASSGERMSHHHGREFHYVLQGTLTLVIGFEQYILEEGDTITFDSQSPHRLENSGDNELRLISVILEYD